jgi:ferredoxin
MAYVIRHDRNNCIGCGACVSINPNGWEMEEDGKSMCIGARKGKDGMFEKDIEEKEFELNKQAADACPVNVIHIVNKKTGQQII